MGSPVRREQFYLFPILGGPIVKKTLGRVLSCVIALVLLLFSLGKATDILQRKASDIKYSPFFEHAEDYDVLFLGSSHVMNAVFPMELWDEYGITSYNFGGHGNMIPTSYWVLMNALDYSQPKVVVIDCLGLKRQIKTTVNYSYVHLSMDAFPLTITKIKAVNDLLDDPEIERRISDGSLVEAEKRTKIGLLWDFSVYHSRWEELSRDDFAISPTKEYGAQSRIGIAEPVPMIENPGSTFEETVATDYLNRLIEECKERDIAVLLIYLPYPVADKLDWMEINTAHEIAKECNVNFIDFLDENIVDFNVDLYDSDSHVNPAGAWKITDFLGKFLTDKYQVEDHRNDEKYSYWDEDYDTYQRMKEERLGKETDLNTYLMLLEDDDYGYIMSIGDPSIFADTTTLRLLEHKGIDVSAISEATKYILVCGKDALVLNAEVEFDSNYGDWSICPSGEDRFGVYKNNEELFVLGTESLNIKEGAVTVSVFHLDDRERIIDKSEFATSET